MAPSAALTLRDVDDAFAGRTRAEWGEIFDREGIVWGSIAGYDEVVKDPQAAAIGLFPTVDSGVFGDYRWGAARKRALVGWEAARRAGLDASETELR